MKKAPVSAKLALVIALVLGASLTILPSANATTTSFACGTSGTYEVDDTTHTITGHTACIGALNIDSSVTSIGNNAFQSNHDLTAITIPSSVTTIGSSAFNSAYFNSITFNEGLITIGGSAFANTYNNGNLLDISFPNSVTTIGNSAFSQSRFRSFSIGENVTTLGEGAFYNNFGAGPTSIVFRGTSGITAIGNYTFIGYRGTELTLPPNITSIGQRPFEGSSTLQYLIIPSGVTSLGNEIFKSMSGLRTLVFPSALSTIGINGFTGTTNVNVITYCGSSSAVLTYSYPNSLTPVCAKTAIFMNNGGSGTMRSETATSTTNLTANTFTKTSSTFAGWNTKSDGSGTSYSDSAPYAFTSDIVLYAQWNTISVPGAPTIGASAATSATSATVDFTAPASNGGATIDYYQCVSTPTTTTVTLNQSGSGTCTFSGLTTGTSYQFKVRAHNSAGYSNYSSLSSAVAPSNSAPDPEAEKREAERKRQQEIENCKTALKSALANNVKIETGTFAKCGYRPLTNPSEVTVVAKLQNLPVDSRTADSVLTAVVTKIGTYEDIQSNKVQSVTPQLLVQTGIIEATVPNKTVITLQLQKLDQTARDTIAEIDAFIAQEAKKMQTRKEHLAAIIAKINAGK